jgi:hypothetical protein
MQNDKKVKNLHLGLHQEVAIPPRMGKLRKNAHLACTTNINLLLQAGLGVNDASQIFERLHQLHITTTNGGVNKQLGGTPAH